jgi:hypothetical protein
MAIRSDTGTSGAPTKVDYDMNLHGKQVVTGGIVGVEDHLPYSPAEGFPLEDVAFNEGRDWAEVTGKVNPGTGVHGMSW